MDEQSVPPRRNYPVTGRADSGNSDILTRNYLDSLLLEQRHVGSVQPDTRCTLWGAEFATPIMAGGMSPLSRVRPEGSPAYARAAKAAGTVCWTGMIYDEAYEEMLATGARCIRIVKPYADHDRIYRAAEHDAAHGALAFAMDIDHVFTSKGSYQTFQGAPLGTQTVRDLNEYARCSPLPFLVKGVLSVRDAVLCAEAGVAGIVVSHHQNLFPWSVPPLKLLPEIVRAVGGTLPVYLDCGMVSGLDVYKAPALGADGVCAARCLREAFAQGGEQAVTERIRIMTGELAGAMARTGVDRIGHFDPTVLHRI